MITLWLFVMPASAQTIRVGAKHFTEGYIISEIISQLLEHQGFMVERKYNLGGTLVCFEALRKGEIDIYPEYSGTIASEILKADKLTLAQLNERLGTTLKMSVSSSFGFSNSYGLVLSTSMAKEKNLQSISDLKNHPNLKLGLSYEFLKRQDGWDNLAQAYSLPQTPVGLEHGLAYQALLQKKIDVTDAYTTDGEIAKNNLLVLTDDQAFFPMYEATALYHQNLNPHVKQVIERLADSITEIEMQQMNAEALYHKKTFAEIASEFLSKRNFSKPIASSNSIISDLLLKTLTHLKLTFLALMLATLVAVPLGMWLASTTRLSKSIVYLVGLLQTIPSIAFLAIMIPFLGIGQVPAVIALFLYALLPILRNTITGLQSVDPLLKKVADGIGMSKSQKLKWVEIPLAMPTILAGIRTAAVINVGTATLAAFIGAGGLGEYIVTGLALNNTELILRGAIPAALLALGIEFLFELLERRFNPRHL